MENVWGYPRPPAVEPCPRRVRVELAAQVLADSRHALRVLETSHPPTIYVPMDDVRMQLLITGRVSSTWCEFKGAARYLDALIDDQRFQAVAWTYPQPSPGYDALANHVAFYPGRVDAAWLDDERVLAQPGDFYGGWITTELIGPFKGAPGRGRLDGAFADPSRTAPSKMTLMGSRPVPALARRCCQCSAPTRSSDVKLVSGQCLFLRAPKLFLGE